MIEPPFAASVGFPQMKRHLRLPPFVRFRRLLAVHQLDRTLLEAVTMQIKSKAVTVKTGTLIDATIFASATEDDDDARWVKHKGKRAVHGFKAHVGEGADTALVEEVSVTSANINDGKAVFGALPYNPGGAFAGNADRGNHFRCRACERRHTPDRRHRHLTWPRLASHPAFSRSWPGG